jgi:hypothetical protein
VRYRFGQASYEIEMKWDDSIASHGDNGTRISVDGVMAEGNAFALIDDGTVHSVKVTIRPS